MTLSSLVWVALLSSGLNAAPDWKPEVFDYDRPLRLEVTEKGQPPDALPDTRQQDLTFRNLGGQEVPVRITLPPKGKGPFVPVLVLHPLGGDRVQMTRDMGKALTEKGFACVALDLPFHGARATKGKPAAGEELFAGDDHKQAYENVVAAVKDVRQTIDLIRQRKDLDADKGVPIVGYSMGAWFGTLTGSADRRVSMLVLQTAGIKVEEEKPRGLFKLGKSERTVLTRYPVLKPETAAPQFAPRPLLMQNGKKDPFISEEQARELFRAFKAPKEIKWYDSGHILPEQAATDATEWIAKNRK